jgi:hypothetical protein
MVERRAVIFADDRCHRAMTKLRILLTALAALALLALPSAASAKRHDSDRDGMPNRWEKKFHLNVHRNDARKDRDHDGLVNRAEFRNHTNPNRADTDRDGLDDGDEVRTDHNPRMDDSDHDGVDDGDETTGTVDSFNAGVLVIKLPDGSTVSGKVTDATEIKCEGGDHGTPTATAAEHGDDSQSGDQGDDSGDQSGPGDEGDDHQGEDQPQAGCDAGALTPGAAVHEADLEIENGTATWQEVELVR